jgi:Fe-S cluster assembly scaffold protein SufB
MNEFRLADFIFDGLESDQLTDLENLEQSDKERLLMAGVDTDESRHSATFFHLDHAGGYCHPHHNGLEIMDIKDALRIYNGLPDYFWKLADKNQDQFSRKAAQKIHGGYFIRVAKGIKIAEPVQSCLFMKAEHVGQSVHNLVIVEEDAEVHIITGCATARSNQHGMHIGISEFYVQKGGKLTFTMIHNWGENVIVRPRSVGVVEEEGLLLSNYILLSPVKSLQMYPTLFLNGRGARCRFNSVMAAPTGSYIDAGNRIILNAPETRAEIISRSITTGGTIYARGFIQGNAVPSRGHLECKGLILGKGMIHAVPELEGREEGVELSHEAAVGKIAQEEIEYLMARGLDEEEATSTIVRGFLNVDIMGLPRKLRDALDSMIAASHEHPTS